jgi:hypothetical protein
MAMTSQVAVDRQDRCGRLEGVGAMGLIAVMVARDVAVLVAATVVLRVVVAGGHQCVATFLVAGRHGGIWVLYGGKR